jgi:hypothetical protein
MKNKVEILKPPNDLRYQHFLTGGDRFLQQFFMLYPFPKNLVLLQLLLGGPLMVNFQNLKNCYKRTSRASKTVELWKNSASCNNVAWPVNSDQIYNTFKH